LISEDLDRDRIVSGYGKPNSGRTFGYVVLAPSFVRSKAWADTGSLVADRDTIETAVDTLNRCEFEKNCCACKPL